MESKKRDALLDIIKFNETLEKQYDNLAEAEINGLLHSTEYNKTLENIKMIFEVMYRKFYNLNLTPEDLVEFDDFIGSLNGYNDEGSDIIIDVLNLSKNNKIRRMCMMLYYYGLENDLGVYMEDEENFLSDFYDEDEYDEYLDEKKKLDDMILDEELKSERFELIKDKLMHHTFMDYLIEEINNTNNKQIRDELIRVKYRLLYVISDFDKLFMMNPYNFSRTIFYQAIMLSNLSMNKELEDVYNEDIYANIEYELKDMSSFDDNFYSKKNNKVIAILRCLYIKMHLSILSSPDKIEECKILKGLIKEDVNCKKTADKLDYSYNLSKSLILPKKVDL